MDYELQILLSLFWKEVVYLGLGNIICYKVKKKGAFRKHSCLDLQLPMEHGPLCF